MKGFPVVSYISSPFLKLRGANCLSSFSLVVLKLCRLMRLASAGI
jgi:hypothetical protein